MSKNKASDEEIGEDEFQVERIIKVRYRNGKREFFLKWKGYPESDNTWEPEDHLECPELIKEFESSRNKENKSSRVETTKNRDRKRVSEVEKKDKEVKEKDKEVKEKEKVVEAPEPKKQRSSSPVPTPDPVPPVESPTKEARGFGRGLKPEKILGATDSTGEVLFLIKWKDSGDADLVPSREANVKCPQVVIRFYEERLTWYRSEDKNDKPSLAATNEAST